MKARTSDDFKKKFDAMSQEELRDHFYRLKDTIERLEEKISDLEFEDTCAFSYYQNKYMRKDANAVSGR